MNEWCDIMSHRIVGHLFVVFKRVFLSFFVDNLRFKWCVGCRVGLLVVQLQGMTVTMQFERTIKSEREPNWLVWHINHLKEFRWGIWKARNFFESIFGFFRIQSTFIIRLLRNRSQTQSPCFDQQTKKFPVIQFYDYPINHQLTECDLNWCQNEQSCPATMPAQTLKSPQEFWKLNFLEHFEMKDRLHWLRIERTAIKRFRLFVYPLALNESIPSHWKWEINSLNIVRCYQHEFIRPTNENLQAFGQNNKWPTEATCMQVEMKAF